MNAPEIEHEVPPRQSPEERWAEIQRRGIFSFVLWRGVVLMAFAYAVARFIDLCFGLWPGAQWHGWRFELFWFVLIVIVYGSITGLCDWRSMKRRVRP
jgi:hypothetical protein